MNLVIHACIKRTDKTTTGETPTATSLLNLIQIDQIRQIKQISSSLELPPNYISQKLFGMDYDYLSIAGADDVINILNEMKGVIATIHK